MGLLWRPEWDPPQPDVPIAETCRLRGVFAAFAGLGVVAEPVVYSDTHNEVVGFAHQHPRGLVPPTQAAAPSGKAFELPTAVAYSDLRTLMESEWLPEMQQILGIDTPSLPVIWDTDFLYGQKTASGDDTYLLCEINASSTFAFPEQAMATVARATLSRIDDRSNRQSPAAGSEQPTRATL